MRRLIALNAVKSWSCCFRMIIGAISTSYRALRPARKIVMTLSRISLLKIVQITEQVRRTKISLQQALVMASSLARSAVKNSKILRRFPHISMSMKPCLRPERLVPSSKTNSAISQALPQRVQTSTSITPISCSSNRKTTWLICHKSAQNKSRLMRD